MTKRRFSTHWLKVSLTGLGAIAAVGAAVAWVKPPPLTPVAVLTHPMAALGPVTAADIRWIPMEHPPHGTITAWAGDPVAAQALPAGTVLTQADLTTVSQAVGLKAQEIRYVVTVTAASAVIAPGERVDVWSLPTSGGNAGGSTPTELALGVRVLGLYSAQGVPVGTTPASGGLLNTGSTQQAAPALAALAIPQGALPAIIAANPGQTVLLLQDPSQSRFALMTAPTGSTPATVAPSGSSTGGSASSPKS